MENRIKYIDKLKGFAILLVIMGHITEKSFGIEGSYFSKFCGSIHTPLLMFLSGVFVLQHVIKYNFKAFFKFVYKKFLRLMIPFFTFGGSYIILRGRDGINFNDLDAYWFLPALFYCMITIWLLKAVVCKFKKIFIKSIIGIILWCALLILYYLDVVSWIPFYLNYIKMFPFFMMGVLYNKYKDIFLNDLIYSISILGYIICWVLPINSIQTYKIPAIFACIILVKVFQVYDDKISEKFCELGEKSLEIYVLHYFFLPSILCLQFITKYTNKNVFYNGNFIVILCISGFIAFIIAKICIWVSNIFKKSKVFNFLCFGELKINK